MDSQVDETLVTAHAGVPLVLELFRQSGGAEVMDRKAEGKVRRRGLTASQMAEGFFALWSAGGERREDFEQLREDQALALLVGHEFAAPQTARDFLEGFHQEDLPLLQQGPKAKVPDESQLLKGLGEVRTTVSFSTQPVSVWPCPQLLSRGLWICPKS